MSRHTMTPGIPAYAKFVRWVAAIHVLALIAQITLAISFVCGVVAAYPYHANVAWLVFGLGFFQACLMINPAFPSVHKMYFVFAIAIALGEAAQLFVIPRGQPTLHVSVAVLVWGLSVALYVRFLDPDWIDSASSVGD